MRPSHSFLPIELATGHRTSITTSPQRSARRRPADRSCPVWNNGAVSSPADPISLRRSYESGQLSEDGLAPSWREQLQRWYEQASADKRIIDPNAMQVATAGADGLPDVRTVLARGFDEFGVV